jgi:hypothetical protein
MRIEILYVTGCGNWRPTRDLVQSVAMDLDLAAEIASVEITSMDMAVERGFLGSPSVHINGIDIDPATRTNADYSFG